MKLVQHKLTYRAWDDGCVLFVGGRNDTIFLDPVGALAIEFLDAGVDDEPDLSRKVTARLPLQDEQQVARYINQFTRRLAELGLLEGRGRAST